MLTTQIGKYFRILTSSILVLVFVYSFFHLFNVPLDLSSHNAESAEHQTCIAFFDIQTKFSCTQKEIFILLLFVVVSVRVLNLNLPLKINSTQLQEIGVFSYLKLLFSRGILHGKIPS